MPSVFLCHSSQDKFFVRNLALGLAVHGVKVWLDEAEIQVGESLTDKIGKAIGEVDYVAVVLSHNSVNSEWVQKELQIALQRELTERQVVVLPLLLEPVDIPPFLKDKLYADFSDQERYSEAMKKLLKAIGVNVQWPQPSGTRVTTVPQPTPTIEPETRISTASSRRLNEFEDIRIIGLDEHKTHNPDTKKALYNVYLQLSGVPPSEWQMIFEEERRFPRHTMWRRAWAEGQYIVVHCVPSEVEKYHLSDLKQDVTNSNAKYRQYLTEQSRKETRELERQQAESRQVKDLKDRLKFE